MGTPVRPARAVMIYTPAMAFSFGKLASSTVRDLLDAYRAGQAFRVPNPENGEETWFGPGAQAVVVVGAEEWVA